MISLNTICVLLCTDDTKFVIETLIFLWVPNIFFYLCMVNGDPKLNMLKVEDLLFSIKQASKQKI